MSGYLPIHKLDAITHPFTHSLLSSTIESRLKSRQARINKFYTSGTHHGSPCAWMCYTLATQSRFGNVGDLLWLGIVGTTDSHVNGRLDRQGYHYLATNLREHQERIFPDSKNRAVGNDRTVYAVNDPHQTEIQTSSSGLILSEKEVSERACRWSFLDRP